MTLTLLAPAAQEPVQLGDLKDHLRLSGSADDVSVAALGVAARQALEARAGIAFLTQSWSLSTDLRRSLEIVIPVHPVISVETVRLFLEDDTQIDLPPDDYRVSTGAFGRVQLKTCPPVKVRPLNGIEIRFTAGYPSPGAIPAELRHAIRLLTAHFFENREAASEARVFSIPQAIDSLIAPYRRLSL